MSEQGPNDAVNNFELELRCVRDVQGRLVIKFDERGFGISLNLFEQLQQPIEVGFD